MCDMTRSPQREGKKEYVPPYSYLFHGKQKTFTIIFRNLHPKAERNAETDQYVRKIGAKQTCRTGQKRLEKFLIARQKTISEGFRNHFLLFV